MIFQKYFSCRITTVYFTFSRKLSSCNKWNVLFFGSDRFSLQSLKKIYSEFKENSTINKLEIVSNTAGKRNEIIKFSENNNLKIHSWPLTLSSDELFHVGIVVSFGFLIPKRIINIFPLGMLNVHASLLPQWRGAAPIVYSLLNGDRKTGISIMKIHPHHFDVGDIIYQKSIEIDPHILQPELHDILANMGSEALIDCIKNLPDSLNHACPQNIDNVTYAPKFKQTLAIINWKENTAIQIYNLSRALFGIYRLETTFKNYRLKLKRIHLPSEETNKYDHIKKVSNSPGHFDFVKDKNIIRVWCKNDTFVYFNSVQIKGKREMSALDFRNGYMKNVPTNELFFK